MRPGPIGGYDELVRVKGRRSICGRNFDVTGEHQATGTSVGRRTGRSEGRLDEISATFGDALFRTFHALLEALAARIVARHDIINHRLVECSRPLAVGRGQVEVKTNHDVKPRFGEGFDQAASRGHIELAVEPVFEANGVRLFYRRQKDPKACSPLVRIYR